MCEVKGRRGGTRPRPNKHNIAIFTTVLALLGIKVPYALGSPRDLPTNFRGLLIYFLVNIFLRFLFFIFFFYGPPSASSAEQKKKCPEVLPAAGGENFLHCIPIENHIETPKACPPQAPKNLYAPKFGRKS